MSKSAVVGRVKRLQRCDTCATWLRKGYKVYKWWPSGDEVERYPKVWVCRLCFTKLLNGALRPEPLPEPGAAWGRRRGRQTPNAR